MNLQRFEEFKTKSALLIDSSEWLCCQIDKIVEAFAKLPDNTSHEQLDAMLDHMNHLQLRANWEEQQHKRLLQEYKDVVYDEP